MFQQADATIPQIIRFEHGLLLGDTQIRIRTEIVNQEACTLNIFNGKASLLRHTGGILYNLERQILDSANDRLKLLRILRWFDIRDRLDTCSEVGFSSGDLLKLEPTLTMNDDRC